MTFENAPSSIDGALLTSALVRKATFAGTNGAEGIVLKDDLKVSPLGTPGNGALISAGSGIVLNKYQTTNRNESYVVSNPGVHTIGSGSMPGSQPSDKWYIIAVVIGDPDFSQTGHPWMTGADPGLGNETTFNYVRPTVIEVSSGDTTIPGNFPALPLARIFMPSGSTTLTAGNITDLRKLAQPRQEQQIFVGNPWSTGNIKYIPSGAVYADWGNDYQPSVKVPSWAKRAIVVCSINGVQVADTSVNIAGGVRVQMGSVVGPAVSFDFPSGISGTARTNLQAAGQISDVTSIAGTTAILRVEGFENVPASPTTNQRLRLTAGSQQVFDVRFFEE